MPTKTFVLEQNGNGLAKIASASPVFRLAVESAFNHIVITDIDGTIVYANRAVERITGYAPEEVVGHTPRIWGGQMPKAFYRRLWNTIRVKKRPFSEEIRNRRKDGRAYVARTVISPIRTSDGTLIGFIGTEEDITREKELEQVRFEFINLAAHQLRTPLTAIGWNIDLLLDPKTGLDKRTSALGEVNSLTHHMIGLVNTLLGIVRIESGRVSVSPRRIRIRRVIDQAVGLVGTTARERSITIAVASGADVVLNADPSHLLEILSNLLSNAVKFSREGTTVRVKVASSHANVSVSVSDHGCGIPKEDQPRLFEKFFRGSNTAGTTGNGLGLYFVKLLVGIGGGVCLI